MGNAKDARRPFAQPADVIRDGTPIFMGMCRVHNAKAGSVAKAWSRFKA